MKLPNLKRGVEVVKEQKPFSGIRLRMPIPSKFDLGRFHLHLLVFPFIYHFNSRIGVLVHSSFAND